MAAVLQYGFVLYLTMDWGGRGKTSAIKTSSSTRKTSKRATWRVVNEVVGGEGSARGWDARRIDRASFVLFPAVTVSLGLVYWIHFLQK